MARQLDLEALEVLILIWHKQFGGRTFKAGDVIRALANNTLLIPGAAFDALIGDASMYDSNGVLSLSSTSRVGIILARGLGKSVDGLGLSRKRDTSTGQWTYSIGQAPHGLPLLVPRAVPVREYPDMDRTMEEMLVELSALSDRIDVLRMQIRNSIVDTFVQ